MAESFALPHPRRLPRSARLAAGIAVALAAAIGLLWAVPAWMDWSAYRGALAAYAARALGRPVHIDGPIEVALLPSPMVTAGDVRLDDRGDGIAMTAPALRLRLAAGPLLTGHVVPRALILVGASIRMPWPLPPDVLGANASGWLTAASARLEASRLTLGSITLRDVTADLGPNGSDLGGLALQGTGRALGQSWRFADQLGSADAAGDAPLDATLEADQVQTASDTGVHFAGLLLHDGTLRGRLSAHATDLSRVLPAPAIAGSLDGTVTLGNGPAVGALSFSLGSMSGTAALSAARDGVTQIASVTLGSVDLGQWAVPHRRGSEFWAGAVWPGKLQLDVSAGAVTLGGGVLRAVHGTMDWADGAGRLREAAAILPGEAPLTLRGAVTQNGFQGDFTVDAPQLRMTLDWLIGCGLRLHANLPPEVLRQATFSGHATITDDRIDLDKLQGSIEQSVVAGHLGVERATGAMDADLTLDRLAADNWLLPGDLPAWPAISGSLADTDLALKLHVGQVTLRGDTLDNFALDAATDAGGVAINAAAFDADGLHGTLAGTIDRDGTVTGAVLDLGANDGRELAKHLPAWAQFTNQLWSGPVRLHVEANGPRDALLTSIGLDLSDARLEAHPAIDLTKGVWSTQMTLRHPGAPRLLAALGWPHAEAWLGEGSMSMLAQLSGAPGHLRFDSFDLTAATLHATGDLAWATAPATPGKTVPSLALGQATPASGPQGPSLTGHINADTLPLPGLSPHDAAPVALGWLNGLSVAVPVAANSVSVGNSELLTNAKAQLSVAAGVAKLDGLTATMGGGSLTGSAALDASGPVPKFVGQASVAGAKLAAPLFGTPLDVSAGTFDATLQFAGQGFSPSTVLASLSGTVHAHATGGTLAGFDLDAAQEAGKDAAALSAGQNGGVTPFDTLDVDTTLTYGVATLTRFALAGSDGVLTATGQVDLSGGLLDILAAMPDQRDLRLTGAIGAPVLGPSFGR